MQANTKTRDPFDQWLQNWFERHAPKTAAKAYVLRCGAHCKSTRKPCQARALPNGRCKYHGGLSRGPITLAGRQRALANLRQFRQSSL